MVTSANRTCIRKSKNKYLESGFGNLPTHFISELVYVVHPFSSLNVVLHERHHQIQ